jgi:hypothetical protein
MVALNPSARADTVRRLLGRKRAHCVVENDGRWFPAVISVRWPLPHGGPVRAALRAHLLAGEPEAFLAAGQPFNVWADAIVDDQTVRGECLLGDGVIVSQEPVAGQAPPTAARPALTDRRTVAQPRPGARASTAGGRQ